MKYRKLILPAAGITAVAAALLVTGCAGLTAAKTADGKPKTAAVAPDLKAMEEETAVELTGDAKTIAELDPVKPESFGNVIELADASKLTVDAPMPEEITDETVKENIDFILSNHDVDTDEVKDGYTANIDFTGKVDGKEFDGGTAEGFSYEMGGSQKLIDGFEDGLKGMKPGEKKTLELKFPDSYSQQDLAGKDVEFEVTLNSVTRPMTFDDLNDGNVSDVTDGKYDTVEAFEEGMREELEKAAASDAEVALSNNAIDEFVKNCKIEVSDEAVDWMIDLYTQYYENALRAKDSASGLADYLEMSQKTYDSFREDLGEEAKTQAERAALILAIADKEGISYSEEALSDYLKEFGYEKSDIEAAGFPEQMVEQSVIQYLVGKKLSEQVKVNYIPYDEYKAAEEKAE